MTREEAVKLIRSYTEHPVAVAFLKRSDKSLRIMVCRTQETFAHPDRITVRDLKLNDYRCIPVEGIIAVSTKDRWEGVS